MNTLNSKAFQALILSLIIIYLCVTYKAGYIQIYLIGCMLSFIYTIYTVQAYSYNTEKNKFELNTKETIKNALKQCLTSWFILIEIIKDLKND